VVVTIEEAIRIIYVNTFCTNCQKPVNAKGGAGLLDWVLVLCTAGIWLVVLPFRKARCPSCGLNGTLQHVR
jgi:hypothetical protein